MNILILNWRDIEHPLAGGAETMLFEHAKYWREKGAHIIWFTSGFKGAKREKKIEGITFIRRGSVYTVHLHAFFYYLKRVSQSTDIVVDNFHFIPFFTPLYIKKKKIIALIHEVAKNVWFYNLPYPLALIGYIFEPFIFLLYKNIPFITVSQSTKKELIQFGINEKNILITPNGLRKIKKPAYKKENMPTIIFLGKASKDKGIIDALESFLLIKKKLKNSKLWIVGKQESYGDIQQVLKNQYQEIVSSVTVFGFVSEEKKYELLSRAWVLVHPSKREGWGLNVIEANSVGTPCIGYTVPGLQDSIRHNVTGMLTKQNNPEYLAKTIIKVLADRNLYKRLSIDATKWANTFSWEESTKKSWSIIKKYEKDKK